MRVGGWECREEKELLEKTTGEEQESKLGAEGEKPDQKLDEKLGNGSVDKPKMRGERMANREPRVGNRELGTYVELRTENRRTPMRKNREPRNEKKPARRKNQARSIDKFHIQQLAHKSIKDAAPSLHIFPSVLQKKKQMCTK